MERRTWAKLVIGAFLIVSIALGIYLRWRPIRRGFDLSTDWGQGDLKITEMAYHRSRIDRIIANWQQTARDADREMEGRLKESYRTFLVIDLDKQAIWMEDDGQIQEDNYAEFPPGMKWRLDHLIFPTRSAVILSRRVETCSNRRTLRLRSGRPFCPTA